MNKVKVFKKINIVVIKITIKPVKFLVELIRIIAQIIEIKSKQYHMDNRLETWKKSCLDNLK